MTAVPDRLSAALSDRYRLERELGQGGMATVYLAEDLKHKRKVALKVLKPELAAVLGAERFVQEITTTAALQHPHILPLFDSGEADGFLFYVMPFIDGETLRGKLDRETQLGVDEAVRITVEVADALDYAHRHGVIHRDIKPENILLHDGRPMVADFGIALAVSAAAGGRMTETGLSLGTPHYMSPEQATAEKDLSGRSDVYSLASVLYEMLAGQPPHLGGSAQQIIMKIIAEPADAVTRYRKSVPPNVAAAVAKALEKLPADRFESARAFAEALGNEGFRFTTIASAGTAAPAVGRPTAARRLLQVTPWVLALAGIGSSVWLATRPAAEPVPSRWALSLPDGVSIPNIGGSRVAISRDGSRIAIIGQGQDGTVALYLRRVDDPVAQLVRGSEGESPASGYAPRFSPDGERLIFATREGIKQVSAAGGTAQTIDESGSNPSWGDGGRVVFVRGNDLWIGSAEGRDAGVLQVPDTAAGVYRLKFPYILPGSEYALVVLDRARGVNASVDSLRLGVISLQDGSITELGIAGTEPHYSRTGHIVFGRAGGLVFAAPFSLSKRTVTGPEKLVLEEVRQGSGGATSFAVSDNGTLVYLQANELAGNRTFLRVDADGRTRPILAPMDSYLFPRLSPDGQRLAAGTFSAGGGGEVWLVNIATGARERLVPEGEDGVRPEWTRDGARVLFFRESENGREVVARSWDRSAPDTVLLRDSTDLLWEIAVGPVGSPVVMRRRRTLANNDLFVAPYHSMAAARPLVATAASEQTPAISADGSLLAYTSNESTTLEVYVQPFPGPGPRIQVSVGGGREPIWSKDGSTLFYRGPRWVMRAELGGSPLQVTGRDSLFLDSFSKDGRANHQNWDVFPGDREFLMLEAAGGTGNNLFTVVNWPQLRTIRSGER